MYLGNSVRENIDAITRDCYDVKTKAVAILIELDPNQLGFISKNCFEEAVDMVRDIGDKEDLIKKLKELYETLIEIMNNRENRKTLFNGLKGYDYYESSGHSLGNIKFNKLYAYLYQTYEAKTNSAVLFECKYSTLDDLYESMYNHNIRQWSWIFSSFCRYFDIDEDELQAGYVQYMKDNGKKVFDDYPI